MTDLLDPAPLTATEIAEVEDAVARLLGTGATAADGTHDVLLVQAEAIAALEAVARSIAAPTATAVNVVTGPYGALFGDWMRASGARVIDVTSALDAAITVREVEAALDAAPEASVLALVHAEAATGGTNPVPEIVALARSRGLVTVLDAVASVGAEPVLPAEWGVDITVIGGQKSLAGPAGVSAAAISPAAWALIDANPAAPRSSFLSLTDIRDGWTRAGRQVVLGTPNVLETRALGQALARVAAEGLGAVITRHEGARAATVAGVEALGLALWQQDAAARAAVDTTVRLDASLASLAPASAGGRGTGAARGLGGILSSGNGPLAASLVRVNHTGRRAALGDVHDALERLAAAAGRDPGPALEAANAAFGVTAAV